MATAEDAYGDVLEICALLQCLGFSVKSLDNSNTNMSQDGAAAGGTRSVVINCQMSGLRVVMEGGSQLCSCPLSNLHTSGFWQVSAVSGGKKRDTESGSSILASLPKEFREQLSRELRELVRSIRGHNESHNFDTSVTGNPNTINNEIPMGYPTSVDTKDGIGNPSCLANGNPEFLVKRQCDNVVMPNGGVFNRSVSNVELKTTPPPLTGKLNVKPDTPTRYRSLDTLTNKGSDPDLPMPRLLSRPREQARPGAISRLKFQRQNTFKKESPESARGSNRTSSPIRQLKPSHIALVGMLLDAEGAADKLREKLTRVIKIMADERLEPLDISMPSLALDVSKISVAKGNEGCAQYASSPNIASKRTDPSLIPRGNLFENASTLSLAPKNTIPGNTTASKISKLRKFSPTTIFKRKDSPSVSDRVGRLNEGVRSCPRPRIATPVQRPIADTSSTKSVCSSLKKKYGHIKSTIPRFTGKSSGSTPCTEKSPTPTPDKRKV